MRRTPDHFYPKVKPDVIADSEKFRDVLLLKDDVALIDEVMKYYFINNWNEFMAFWRNERIDWYNFACYPHNGIYFTQYVFTQYPEVRERAMADLNRSLETKK